VYSLFWLTKAAQPPMPAGAAIINTASIQVTGETYGVTGGNPLP
jgi:NAD(P)-dependent dehydrogenase (short-subunit alcohol dehydrogenase family)